MKDVNLLVWLTQLGLSVAIPLAVFLGGALWLHNSRGWGSWVIWVGLMIGLSSPSAASVSLSKPWSRCPVIGTKRIPRPFRSMNIPEFGGAVWNPEKSYTARPAPSP